MRIPNTKQTLEQTLYGNTLNPQNLNDAKIKKDNFPIKSILFKVYARVC